MSSGLLPKGGSPINGGSGTGFFDSITTDNLIVNSTAVISNLIVSGAFSFSGIFKAAAGIWSDTYANFTAGSTVTLMTRSANANVLLSPNGTGAVVVAAGNSLTADTLAPTTAGAITVSTSSNGNLRLSPNGTGAVVVAAAKTLTADTLSPTTAGALTVSTSTNGNLNLSPNGTGAVVVAAGKTLTADTISTTTAGSLTVTSTATNGNIFLSPTGTGSVVVDIGKSLLVTTVTTRLAGPPLLLTALNPSAGVHVVGGVPFAADTIAPTTAGPITISTSSNGALNLSPNGTGAVTVAAGKTFKADTITTTTAGALTISAAAASNGNINLVPDGTGAVTVAAGQALTADSIIPTTAGPITIASAAGGDINLSPDTTGGVIFSTYLDSAAAAPAFTPDTGAGAGATITGVAGTSLKGAFTLNTGAVPSIANIVKAQMPGDNPNGFYMVLMPANLKAATTTTSVFTNPSGTSIVLIGTGVALLAATSYTWNYIVL